MVMQQAREDAKGFNAIPMTVQDGNSTTIRGERLFSEHYKLERFRVGP